MTKDDQPLRFHYRIQDRGKRSWWQNNFFILIIMNFGGKTFSKMSNVKDVPDLPQELQRIIFKEELRLKMKMINELTGTFCSLSHYRKCAQEMRNMLFEKDLPLLMKLQSIVSSKTHIKYPIIMHIVKDLIISQNTIEGDIRFVEAVKAEADELEAIARARERRWRFLLLSGDASAKRDFEIVKFAQKDANNAYKRVNNINNRILDNQLRFKESWNELWRIVRAKNYKPLS